MPNKTQECTDQHITLHFNLQWYCLPFIVLEDIILPDGTRLDRERFMDISDPFGFLTIIIDENAAIFEPILETCKLYN